MTENNTTDFFDGIGEGAGAPSPLLKNPGDAVRGEIVRMFKRPFIAVGKKEAEKREDGTDKQQLVIVLQTQHRNWENVSKVPKVDRNDPNSAEKPPTDDDGTRAVYVPEGKNIQFAIARACTAAQAKPTVGGTLAVRVFNLKDTGQPQPLKEHEAIYQAPSAGSEFFGGAPAQAPAAAPAPAAPAPVATPAPAAPAPVATPAPAPAQPAAPAPTQDPWATPATPAAPVAGDPWATPAAGTSEPPF